MLIITCCMRASSAHLVLSAVTLVTGREEAGRWWPWWEACGAAGDAHAPAARAHKQEWEFGSRQTMLVGLASDRKDGARNAHALLERERGGG